MISTSVMPTNRMTWRRYPEAKSISEPTGTPPDAINDNGSFAVQQTNGTVFGISEGQSGARDLVDPGFQAGRDAEVINGCANDDGIGVFELIHKDVGQAQDITLYAVPVLGRCEIRVHPGFVDLGKRVGKISANDAVGPKMFKHLGRELTADGLTETGRGVDMQDGL